MSKGILRGKFSTSERRNCSSEYSRSITTLGSLMLSEKAFDVVVGLVRQLLHVGQDLLVERAIQHTHAARAA